MALLLPMFSSSIVQRKLEKIAKNAKWHVESNAKAYLYPIVLKDVYSYDATDMAKQSRRHNRGRGIGDPNNVTVKEEATDRDITFVVNFDAELQDKEYEIMERSLLSGIAEDDIGASSAWSGTDLYDIVESGAKEYRQPYPRPFLDDLMNIVGDEATEYIADLIDRDLEALASVATDNEALSEMDSSIDTTGNFLAQDALRKAVEEWQSGE